MTGSGAPTGIVVDTSAVLAVLLREPGSDELLDRLGAAAPAVMSAATWVELGIVTEARFGPHGADLVQRFLRDAEIDLVAVDAETAERAMSAWRRFGKGRHAAALNFGDCFSYALAEQTGFPLLCVGKDLAATDLDVALR